MPVQNIIITAGGTIGILASNVFSSYYVSGTVTLASSFEVVLSGTAREGMRVRFEYNATLTPGINTITFLGTVMPADYAAKKVNIDCYYNGTAWIVDYQPAFQETDIITSDHIKALAVTTAKINAKAVTVAEMADLTSGQVYVGSAGNRPVAVTPTGDVTISNTGVMAVAADSIINADIKSDAAIGTAKLAAASDIAKLANVTQAQLEHLYGVTAGTAAASKAVVLDASSKIDTIDITSVKIGGVAVTAGAAELNILDGVTATYAELNKLAGVTAGTVTASKALVVDANSKLDSLDLTVLKIGGTAITATAAQINYLATSSADVQTQIDKASAVTPFSTASAATILSYATLKRNYVLNTGAGVVVMTLPPAVDCPDGTTIEFIQKGANAGSITKASTDVIENQLGADVTTLAMSGNGGGLRLTSNGSDKWIVVFYS